MSKGVYKRTEKHKKQSIQNLKGHCCWNEGKELTQEHKDNLSKAHIKAWKEGKYDNRAYIGHEQDFETLSKGHLKAWAEGKYDNRKVSYISSWEDKFYTMLIEHYGNDYEVKRQFRLKHLRHAFDLSIPQLKILIEIDGNWIHSKFDNPERDAKINEFVYRTYPDWVLFRYNDDDLKHFGLIK